MIAEKDLKRKGIAVSEYANFRKPGESYSPPPEDPQLKGRFSDDQLAYAVWCLRVSAGVEPGKWWDVWLVTKKNGKLHLGHVEGEHAEAIKKARKTWPNFVGRMELEKNWVTSTVADKNLPRYELVRAEAIRNIPSPKPRSLLLRRPATSPGTAGNADKPKGVRHLLQKVRRPQSPE